MELLIRCKDGRQRTVLVEGSSIIAAAGASNLITFYDITERKQSESALRNFKALVESSGDAIIGKTLDGMITSWNAGAERIFGYTAGEAIGQPMEMLIPPGRANEEAEILARMIRGERVEHFETLRRHKDGRLVDVLATISPIRNEHGVVCGASKIARDISARKAAEVELAAYRHRLELLVAERTSELTQAKEAAESASRAKSAFLANMSHELRTPMNTIMGMTGLAIRQTRDEKLHSQLDKIEQASRHLLNVINDILDISKIEADRLTLEQAEFRFGAVLENVASIIRHKTAEKVLRLEIDMAPELAILTLRSDPLRLSQVLLNLAGNAVKFTETGSIALRIRVLRQDAGAAVLRCEVQDSGIGISAADQARLFTAFEQADSGMTRKYGGTGLGLAISKRLVKLMGGEIGVVSEPGQGSTFWFAVHAGVVTGNRSAPPTLAAGAAEARIRTEFAGTRILLAEDEPIKQEVSRELLEDAWLVVDVAADGVLAVDMAKDGNYALILMDMQMPNLNGIDATRAIRQLPAYAATPILAMTANAFDEDRQTCLAAGMNDHIGKPVDPELLFTRLLKWLSEAPAASPSAPAPAAGAADITALGAICSQLAELLANHDFAASGLFEANAALLRDGLGASYPALARAIENYDFEDALARLQEVAAAQGSAP